MQDRRQEVPGAGRVLRDSLASYHGALMEPLLRDSGGDEVASLSNEVYLFHGTSELSAAHILAKGFDNRLASGNGLFGAGTYFAENFSKSDEYAGDDDVQHIFLSRCVLGHPYINAERHTGTEVMVPVRL